MLAAPLIFQAGHRFESADAPALSKPQWIGTLRSRSDRVVAFANTR